MGVVRCCADLSLPRAVWASLAMEFGQVVRQGMALEPSPQIFDRVQVGGMGWQECQSDPATEAVAVVPDQARPMRFQPIPDNQQWAMDWLDEGFQELDELRTLDRTLVEAEVGGGETHAGDHRQLLPVAVQLEDRCLSLRRPGTHAGRSFGQAGLVAEDNYTARSLGFFFEPGPALALLGLYGLLAALDGAALGLLHRETQAAQDALITRLSESGLWSLKTLSPSSKKLQRVGLEFLRDGEAVDIAMADQTRGLTSKCTWLEFGHINMNGSGPRVAACRLVGSRVKQMITPPDWKFEGSLSSTFGFVPSEHAAKGRKYLRHGNGIDVGVYLNPITGQEMYVGRTGESQPNPSFHRACAKSHAGR